MRFFYFLFILLGEISPPKFERYMYCQIDLRNKITFQVEKEEDLNVTAYSALNLYSSLMQSGFSSSVVFMWYRWCSMEVVLSQCM